MSYLGIDIGTTGAKAVVFNEEGKSLASVYEEYPTLSPKQGWFELDSQLVIDRCFKIIKHAASIVKENDPVISIGISSQGEAFTLLDKSDKYLCNAMVSSDIRSQRQVEKFTQSFGLDKLYKITGHSPHTLFSVFKLIWMTDNCPDIIDKASKFLCFGDLLCYRLTGEAVTSHNLAARTMMFDVNNLRWSREVLEQVNIDDSLLPMSLPSGKAAGTIFPKIAKELGLSNDVIVTMGGHDQSCGALGVGVTSGMAAYSIGTVECVTPVFDGCLLNNVMRDSNLATYPHVLDGFYTTVAFNMTGGSLLRWLRDTFGHLEIAQAQKTNCDVYDFFLKDLPSNPTSLLLLPHFTATGTPYFDPFPTGAILGLSFNTTKAEFIKAALEGVTYEMKLNLELLKKAGVSIDTLLAFGGGARNSAWLQIKADILNVPIVSLETIEAGCLGAALLAAQAVGHITSPAQTAQKWSRRLRCYEPSTKNTVAYQERFSVYRQIYETIKPLVLCKN